MRDLEPNRKTATLLTTPARPRVVALLLLVALLGCTAPGPVREDRIDGGRLGSVQVFVGADAPTRLVILLAPGDGWTTEWSDMARTLARQRTLVAGVDLARYRRRLAASGDGCHYVVADFEALSKNLQRAHHVAHYLSPVLVGVGSAGTLAYAALAQAPAATLAGAVSMAPAPAFVTTVPLCPGAPASPAAGGGFAYGPQPALPGWWRVLVEHGPAPWVDEAVRAAGAQAAVETTTRAPDAADVLRVLESAAGDTATGAVGDLDDLPVVVLPAAHPGAVMAVILSGDGGWRDLDKQIGEALVEAGVPVVGLDSLRYFWRTKTPERLADDLARIISGYAAHWGTERVVLIGYSFGADVLPFAVPRLRPEVRARVVQVSLLGLGPRAPFEIKLDAWLGGGPPADAAPVAPEMAHLDPRLVQCFYGTEESDSPCPALAATGVEIVARPGGHHFDGNYEVLTQTILAGVKRRVTTGAPAAPL